MNDYSQPILNGFGDTDYARYMRTGELLALQRGPDDVVHHDEIMFQTVHQVTELWLKLADIELRRAMTAIDDRDLRYAHALLRRAVTAVGFVTAELSMLQHLDPWTFQQIRVALGHGSGFESPGWAAVRRTSQELARCVDALIRDDGIDLVTVYKEDARSDVYELMEALIDWDEALGLWRARHFKLTVRIIGHTAVGTKGTPVESLAALLNRQYFPELWRIRSLLTEQGPLASDRSRSGTQRQD
ncbi:tryptophan 2,3-dioxygenase family protein [Nocardia sp. CC227C]|uniref:tryptophan 2,3-dioxygenase family protein n=1 Tax=Nocardia sp. CC227C TaxID=3044562 RepID=UPI00278C5949|nr:tryptophan 2,3-dioxygenase family protein [Nocardia sp. CC227C]